MDKCQEDPVNSMANQEDVKIPEAQRSPELGRKISKTVAARENAGKLKTATLDRMGKIFKLKSYRGMDISDEITPETTKESNEDQRSRREKANSLGRMLKLVDKNGEPRKIFNNSRSGPLAHMFRRKSTGARDDENSHENSSNVGVFSRIFNQWKNRSGSGNTSVEPNLCSSYPEAKKSLSSKLSSTSKMNVSPTCTFPAPSQSSTMSSVVKSADIEYPA